MKNIKIYFLISTIAILATTHKKTLAAIKIPGLCAHITAQNRHSIEQYVDSAGATNEVKQSVLQNLQKLSFIKKRKVEDFIQTLEREIGLTDTQVLSLMNKDFEEFVKLAVNSKVLDKNREEYAKIYRFWNKEESREKSQQYAIDKVKGLFTDALTGKTFHFYNNLLAEINSYFFETNVNFILNHTMAHKKDSTKRLLREESMSIEHNGQHFILLATTAPQKLKNIVDFLKSALNFNVENLSSIVSTYYFVLLARYQTPRILHNIKSNAQYLLSELKLTPDQINQIVINHLYHLMDKPAEVFRTVEREYIQAIHQMLTEEYTAQLSSRTNPSKESVEKSLKLDIEKYYSDKPLMGAADPLQAFLLARARIYMKSDIIYFSTINFEEIRKSKDNWAWDDSDAYMYSTKTARAQEAEIKQIVSAFSSIKSANNKPPKSPHELEIEEMRQKGYIPLYEEDMGGHVIHQTWVRNPFNE